MWRLSLLHSCPRATAQHSAALQEEEDFNARYICRPQGVCVCVCKRAMNGEQRLQSPAQAGHCVAQRDTHTHAQARARTDTAELGHTLILLSKTKEEVGVQLPAITGDTLIDAGKKLCI